MEQLTTVTRKGQITIPAEIRRQLGIEEGDKIAVSIMAGQADTILIRPVRSVAEMTYGLGAALSPATSEAGPTDIRQLRDQFETAAAEDVVKSLSRPES